MTKIEELEQELFEMERKLKSMFNSCSKDLAIGIEKLRDELAELKESKKEGKWKPKEGDEIWFRNMTGKASYLYYQEGIDIKSNLVFPTKEECERYWHFMDTVKEKSYEFSKEEWTNKTIAKYIIQYDYLEEYFFVDKYSYVYTLGTTYFKDKKSAQYIIDNFKDELMEFWI